MATRLKVTYVDGRTVEVLASPRAQIMTEQNFKGITEKNQLQAAYYLAWVSLHKAGKEPAEFDPWLDLIEDVEEVEAEETDPTSPAQPIDFSSS